MSNDEDQGRDPHVVRRDYVKNAIGDLNSDLKNGRRFQMPRIRLPGWFWTSVKILAVAGIIAPVLWALAYAAINPPGTILMVQRWMGGETIRHQNVSADDISPHVVRAVLAAEDARFCEHNGFDIEAIQAALESNMQKSNVQKGKVRGGSTISQQTAKNLFLWPDRSFVRKGFEAYFTFMIELFYPKKRIMQNYLNIAEWGHGVFGVQAASRAYFNVSAGELTPRQAALLAAVLPSPNKWSVKNPGPYVRRRAATIEARMYGIHAQRLDACVLDQKAAPPPRRKGAPSTLPPMEALPPDVAAENDAPVIVDAVAPAETIGPADPLVESTFEDGQLEAPETPPPPEDAPAEALSAAPAP